MKEPLVNTITISVSVLLLLTALFVYVQITHKEKDIYKYVHEDEVSRENIREYNRYANFDNAIGISGAEVVNVICSQGGYFNDIIQYNGVEQKAPKNQAEFEALVSKFVITGVTYKSELVKNSSGAITGINFK